MANSGFRSPKSAAGSKAAGQGSTHTRNAKGLASSGAKASGGPFGNSTHERNGKARAAGGAKASAPARNSLTASGQAVSDPHATAAEQAKPKGRAVEHYHGTEMVSEHHRR